MGRDTVPGMGRRSRSRTTTPRPKAAPAPAAPAGRGRAADRLSPARKTIAGYLGIAMVVSVITILGIATLGGTIGPLLVFAFAALASGLAFRWAQGRLANLEMTDEDRLMQTMAGGLLLISVVLAAVAAIVLTIG